MDRSTGKEDKSFTYDYSFWSAREEDENYTSQVLAMFSFFLRQLLNASLNLRLTISHGRPPASLPFSPLAPIPEPICVRIHARNVIPQIIAALRAIFRGVWGVRSMRLTASPTTTCYPMLFIHAHCHTSHIQQQAFPVHNFLCLLPSNPRTPRSGKVSHQSRWDDIVLWLINAPLEDSLPTVHLMTLRTPGNGLRGAWKAPA